MTLIELREVLPTTTIKLRTSRREALPQLVFCSLVQARSTTLELLPFFKQIAQDLSRLLPVNLAGLFSKDRLCALDKSSALFQSVFLCEATFFLRFFLTSLRPFLYSLDAGAQCRKIANSIWLFNSFLEGGKSLVDLLRPKACQTVFKEFDRCFKVRVATRVKRERIRWKALGEGSDHSLSITVLNPHISLGINSTKIDRKLGRSGRFDSTCSGDFRLSGLGFRRSSHDIPSRLGQFPIRRDAWIFHTGIPSAVHAPS